MLQEVRLKTRQKHGKYKVDGCLMRGPYATVYSAIDTIEGVRVALKIPHLNAHDKNFLADFKREVRIAARLEHPNVLPLKDASVINEVFTMVTPLGVETLEARLRRRLSTKKAFDYARQIIRAIAYAHEQGIMHCDVKPANLILFDDGRLRLADFGIAKATFNTVRASGSGTLGYLAPEQAMGRPSFRSDVFAVGLILHRMLTGAEHEWPFTWPSAGIKRLKERVHPQMVEFLHRALEFKPAARFRDGNAMQNAYIKLERGRQLYRKQRGRRSQIAGNGSTNGTIDGKHWRHIQFKQFRRLFGSKLETHLQCRSCDGPVSEKMRVCPWCRDDVQCDPEKTRFTSICPHCDRGVKKDWEYCPWCFGAGFEKETSRRYADKRYSATCHRKTCDGPLMPFMKYCPWCHARTRQEWQPEGMQKCKKCHWGISTDFWSYCPWCTTPVNGK
ncbi:MAG: protein kinase [Gammaproteobacteria bacterium]|nr:protein kinase [Gammaproteobacteria bacterium]